MESETRRNGPIVADAELEPRAELVNPALEWLAALDEAFEREFNGSPVRRAGFMGLRRNVAIAMGNSGLAGLPALEAWAAAADEGLRAAARWALVKLLRMVPILRIAPEFKRSGASASQRFSRPTDYPEKGALRCAGVIGKSSSARRIDKWLTM